VALVVADVLDADAVVARDRYGGVPASWVPVARADAAGHLAGSPVEVVDVLASVRMAEQEAVVVPVLADAEPFGHLGPSGEAGFSADQPCSANRTRNKSANLEAPHAEQPPNKVSWDASPRF
jgi:hypothetical protein